MPIQGWSGRVDAEDGVLGFRWHQVISPFGEASGNGVCFVGFCSDEGVRRNQGRVGAVDGPGVLRTTMSNLPHRPGENLFDAGDIRVTGNALETGQMAYASTVSGAIVQGLVPIGLGGGHEIAWASWQGLVGAGVIQSGSRVGILNLDAHFDLRTYPVPTSGSSFSLILRDAAKHSIDIEYRVWGISEASNTLALFEVADNTPNVSYELDTSLRIDLLEMRLVELSQWLSRLDHVYLTTCLDVLPASVAPGVSAPSALGVRPEVLEALVEVVGKSGKLRVADFAELCPRLDIDNRTARTASRLIWRLVRSISSS